MTTGMTVVLVVGLLAAFWVAVTVCVNVWRRPARPGGRHRATTAGGRRWAVDDDRDLPPIPHATRQQLREASR